MRRVLSLEVQLYIGFTACAWASEELGGRAAGGGGLSTVVVVVALIGVYTGTDAGTSLRKQLHT